MSDDAKEIDQRFDDLLEAMAKEAGPLRTGNINLPEPPREILTEEDVKDELHCRLNAKCEYDPLTDCWIWTGAWQDDSGLGVLRVGGETVMVSRVAAWVYLGGFDFWDTSFNVVHTCDCPNPACFNCEHLLVKGGEWCGAGVQYAGQLCEIPTRQRKVPERREPMPVAVSDSEFACVLG